MAGKRQHITKGGDKNTMANRNISKMEPEEKGLAEITHVCNDSSTRVADNTCSHTEDNQQDSVTVVRDKCCRKTLSASELAEYWGVSLRHVHRMNSSQQLPSPVHIGRCVRWLVDEIDAWLVAGAPDRKTWGVIKHEKGN